MSTATMDPTKQETERLAEAVKQRLAYLGWTIAELHRQMQTHMVDAPSLRTVHNTMQAVYPPSTTTKRAFELALGWPAGSAARIMEGEERPEDTPLDKTPTDFMEVMRREISRNREDILYLRKRVEYLEARVEDDA